MINNIHLNNAEIARKVIEDHLPSKGIIELDNLNYFVQQLVNSTKNIQNNIPLSMSTIFANYTLANFISQFQVRIDLDGSLIPVNMVGFLLSGSGLGKDSTITGQERAVEKGYNVIQRYRENIYKERATKTAEEKEGDPGMWRQFFKHPEPLQNSISTVEGLSKRLNNFKRDGIGMSSILVSELGSELQTNPDITGNLRLISELFDMGNKKSKAIKDDERQDQPISGMGICGLFVGSEDNIVMDKTISQKFKTEFVTKLARRTFFVYPSKQEFDMAIVRYKDFQDMLERQHSDKIVADEARAAIGHQTEEVAEFLVDHESRRLEISPSARELYEAYKIYCNSLGNGLDYIHKSCMIEQIHRHWKVLKLAGAYACMRCSTTVERIDLEEAMYFAEKVGKYLEDYENYASKDSYELLFDYLENNHTIKLTLHELKKRGFIIGTNNFDTKAKELAKMADSYAGPKGSVMFDGVMQFKPFETVGSHIASYMQVTGSKQERAVKCHSGYIAKETSFEKLSNLLVNDTAYTPFRFSDGKRSNSNIISGATWIALDIDKTMTSIYEMHDILGDYNHHLCTTSDKENIYKYRIILEFSQIVDIPPHEWKHFCIELCKELGISEVDEASFTKSQIMFGYKDSLVLSLVDTESYDVSECIKKAMNKDITQKPLTLTQKKNALDSPLQTFAYAFDAKDGEGSLMLYRAFKHASDMGASKNEVIQLITDINGYWENPLEDERLEKTILNQVNTHYDKSYK